MFKLGEKKEKLMMMRDMRRNSELETLLSEIPESPPFINLQRQSAMGRVSPPPSSSLSNGFSSPDDSSPFEVQQHQPMFHHYGLWLDSKSLPDSHLKNKNINENGFGLSENLYQMHIRDEEKDGNSYGEMRRFERDPDGFGDVSSCNAEKYGSCVGFNKGSEIESSPLYFGGGDVIRSTLLGYQKGDSLGSYGITYNQSKSIWHDNRRNHVLEQRMEQGHRRSPDSKGILLHDTTFNHHFVCPQAQHYGIDGKVVLGGALIDSLTSPSPSFLHTKIPVGNVGDPSVIIEETDLKYGINKDHDSFKCDNKKSVKGSKLGKIYGQNVTLIPNSFSLVDLQGRIYHMAKDQNGCRFLQRIFDEGSCLHMQIIFKEVIEYIVELMMDPFGNYLVQKLLDVCTEEQTLQIVLMVTKESGQLVRISLNTYGTRVVQKLIETLKSRQQISLIKSALKPGILDLIKDLNGNHVLQRCLQCLDNEDNKIIFDAAAKFCVDIATHRHGCCVLQRCIAHSNGQHRDKLITQISKNGLLLAQDPFGNYVVQYIIELKVPSVNCNLLSQFKGHYLHLSLQKFSSHVVEKCLKHIAESRPQIVRELISVVHFEQLLQDPFANYVIQSALVVTKGNLHVSLVEAIRPHTILRTSPYCKRIFSRNLLKK